MSETMHQQQVIMWLGVELAEKKSRIVDLENENAELRGMLEATRLAQDREEAGKAE